VVRVCEGEEEREGGVECARVLYAARHEPLQPLAHTHTTFSLTHDPFSLTVTGPTLQPLHAARPDFAGSTIQCEEGLADTSKATATALELLMLTKTESPGVVPPGLEERILTTFKM